MINKGLGVILVIDSILSLFLPSDKQIMWQMGRVVRLIIGVYLIWV
jgi:hypothetical protein